MRYFRFILLIFVLWIAALLAVRQFVCIGWVVPIRVASHSMAPALYGPHDETICQGCGHWMLTSPGDTASLAAASVVDCLNCGEQTPTTKSVTHVGSRVLIDRWAMRSGIQRFDIVALVAAGDEGPQLTTKRVIGMPGEIISLRDGDVYADDVMVRKSASQFSEMAILVHTDRHRRNGAKPRWRSANETHWTVEKDGYRWRKQVTPPAEDDTIEWLNYHHRPSSKVVATDSSSPPVYDDYQFNQAVSRALHRVHDLALAAELEWNGVGTIHVRCPTPLGTCEMRFGTTTSGDLNSIELWRDETLLAETPEDFSMMTRENRIPILFGYWDCQLVCRLGDVEVLRHRFEASTVDATSAEPETQFALAATQVEEFLVTELRVWRDLVYYLPDDVPSAVGEATARALAPRLANESYLLLGDNVPQSKDARYGAEFGIVSAPQILGVVQRVN